MPAVRLVGLAATATAISTHAATGVLIHRVVSSRTCVKEEWHHLGPAVRSRYADVRNAFSIANRFGKSNGRSTSNTNDHVSVVDAGNSVVHNMRRYANHSRVEDPRVEVWDKALNTAS